VELVEPELTAIAFDEDVRTLDEFVTAPRTRPPRR
jgi:hypothetical protein